MRSSTFNSRAIKISLIYLVIGIVYIIFSDILAEKIFGYPSELTGIQTFKGLLFVLITAFIIYLLVLNEFKKHKRAGKKISEKYITELKQRNDFIQTVLDNLPIGIALNKFNEGYSTYMNKRFIEIYGWPEEELTNIQKFFTKVYPDKKYREELYNRIMEDINSGDPARMHWDNIEIIRKDGGKRIVNAVNIPLLEQNTMVSTVMDVTEEKKSESSLRHSKAFITSVLDNLPVGISVVDKGFKYVLFNKALLNFSKARSEEIIGKSAFDTFPYLEKSGLSNYMERAMSGEKVITDDYPDPGRGNNDRWFYSIYYPNKDAEGNIIGIISQVTEITERKMAEKQVIEQNFKYEALNEELTQTIAELYRAKEKAEESNNLKTAFLQNMSHEIRTPLNGIVGYSELLKDPSLTCEKRNFYTDIVIKSSDQLLSIVTDIITISTLETKQQSLNVTEFRLNELMKDIEDIFKNKVVEKGLEMIHSNGLEDNESVIISDRNKIIQVYTNLISNAIKFTDHGYIEFGYTKKRDQIECYVKDTGIGIEYEMHEKIFERFRQVASGSAGKYGGTGLGLSISKGLVDLLGGRIWIDSKPGKGSAFYFTVKSVL
ncbi:MAG: PAS domain-containing sensor histidine kinase [Bacteroidota bacterium]